MKAAPKKKFKVQRGTSLSTAFLQLRELIVMGQMAPGSWIVEADLAERLGLSRTPIRGALQLLQREGYVVEHKSGTKTRMLIAPLTMEDAEELYRIVGGLEGLAGYRIGTFEPAVREKLADALESINAQIADIANEGKINPRRIFDLDAAFHLKIVEAAAGPRLLSLHRSVKPQIERYWRLYASSIISQLHLSAQEHADIIAAIRKGHPRLIERAIEHNWAGGFSRVAHLITLFGERGSW